MEGPVETGGWLAEARERVTDNPALEEMQSGSCRVAAPPEVVWQAIRVPRHWQADRFHNDLFDISDEGGVGTSFAMRHTNWPIIPWPMEDQRFAGVITHWQAPRQQVLAELNMSDAGGAKRTPDHQQTIVLDPDGADGTVIRLTVSSIRVANISPLTRAVFRPWAKRQLAIAIGRKLGHIKADVARRATV